MKIRGENSVESLRNSIFLSFSLLLSVNAAEASSNQPTLRDFRNQNPELGRREARSLYRDTFARGNRQLTTITPQTVSNQNTSAGVTNSSPTPVLFNDRRLLNNTLQTSPTSSRLVRLNGGVSLDLTSQDKNIVLGGNLFKEVQSIDISVGGEKKTLSAGVQVTAAEYIAAKQALSGSGQKLSISSNGTAGGGSIDLTDITADNDHLRASNLTVAAGVTTYGDFGKRSDFTLLGDLNNFGSVYALSSSDSVKAGAIRAGDITNQQGALISTLSNTDRLDLELNARGALTNLGDISSSGNLTLAAGDSITNKGSVSAGDSVNLNASNITNSSRIEAASGNVNISGSDSAVLAVNNNQGVISALNGAINARTSEYTGAFDNKIDGGDLLSEELNLHAGTALNYVKVNQLTGVVNQYGLGGHVTAGTDNLTIGDTCLTGDPTFFNTAGNITINGNLSAAEALTIIASGNIFGQNGFTIEARNASTGFDITMIAGANIVSTTGGSNSSNLPGGSAGAVTLDGNASATGGGIFLGTNQILTSPTGATGNGGNASFFAYKGSTSTSGMLDLDFATINTGGRGTGTNGNVVAIGGGINNVGLGSAIQFGSVDTTGGTGGGGNFTAVTAQPQSSGGNIVYNADGTRAAGAQLVAGSTLTANADIGFIGAKTTTVNNNVTLRAGSDIGEVGGATLFVSNFDASVILEAGDNIGNDNINPFVITGFNTLFTKKVLKTLQPGNGNLTANADNVFIRRDATTKITLTNSHAENFFFLTTNSALTVDGTLSSNTGVIDLTNTGGAFLVTDNSTITAPNLISLTNASTKKVEPTFTLSSGVLIATDATISGQGDIFLILNPDALENASVNRAQRVPALSTNSRRTPTLSKFEPKPIRFELLEEAINIDIQTNGAIFGKGKLPKCGSNPKPTLSANDEAKLTFTNFKKAAMEFASQLNVQAVGEPSIF